MKSNFIIIRYFIGCLCITDNARAVYEKIYRSDKQEGRLLISDPRNKIINKITAHKLIDDMGMVEVISCIDGQVWESPI